MRDLQADWQRWTRAERIVAMLVGIATGLATPVLFVLDTL